MDTNEHDRLSNITLIQYANVNSEKFYTTITHSKLKIRLK